MLMRLSNLQLYVQTFVRGKIMKLYVLKKWEVRDLVGYWVNNGVVATIDEAESYVEYDRENRDYDEYNLDVSNLTYNRIFNKE